MDRDFLLRQTLVWLEVEGLPYTLPPEIAPPSNLAPESAINVEAHRLYTHRKILAESLTNHLVNNWEIMERAQSQIDQDEQNRISDMYRDYIS